MSRKVEKAEDRNSRRVARLLGQGKYGIIHGKVISAREAPRAWSAWTRKPPRKSHKFVRKESSSSPGPNVEGLKGLEGA